MPKRRPWGSIEVRGGSIRVRPPGSKEWHTMPRGSVRKDAERWLEDERRRRETGCAFEPSRVTVREFLAEVWLPARVEDGTIPGTLRHYRECIARLVPLIGEVRLQALTRQQVETVRSQLQEGVMLSDDSYERLRLRKLPTPSSPSVTRVRSGNAGPGLSTRLQEGTWLSSARTERNSNANLGSPLAPSAGATTSRHSSRPSNTRGSLALSPKTVNNILNCLRTALAWAVGHDLLTRNVADSVYVKRLKVPKHEPRVLTADEARCFLAACRTCGAPYGPYLAAAILTGQRVKSQWGAMRWADVDLAGRRAYMHRTMDRDGSIRELRSDDYKGGSRWIALPKLLVPFLEAQRAWQREVLDNLSAGVTRLIRLGEGYARTDTGYPAGDSRGTVESGRSGVDSPRSQDTGGPDSLRAPQMAAGAGEGSEEGSVEVATGARTRTTDWVADEGARLVFTNDYGQRIPATSLYVAMQQVRAAAGIVDHVAIHDLRHSTATLLLAFGADLKEIQAVLGHSKLATTADIYSHLLPGKVASTVDLLDGLEEAQ